MAENTKISWATHTWNPWVGCDKVSPACDSCYAEAWAKRAGDPQLWQGERRRTKTWRDPYRWHEASVHSDLSAPLPSVFTCSLADFFDNHPAVTPWRAEAWKVIEECFCLTWYLVTKRIPNVGKILPPNWDQDHYRHVVIIITVVTQDEWDRDGPRLKALKDRFPWLRVGLSVEPMLGMIDLGECSWLDWVICGGESGGQARPLKVSWVRSLRDQCLAAGVPFHFKQWGEFHHDGQQWPSGMYGMRETPGVEPEATRVGVKKSGRRLDGRTHDDGPRKVAA